MMSVEESSPSLHIAALALIHRLWNAARHSITEIRHPHARIAAYDLFIFFFFFFLKPLGAGTWFSLRCNSSDVRWGRTPSLRWNTANSSRALEREVLPKKEWHAIVDLEQGFRFQSGRKERRNARKVAENSSVTPIAATGEISASSLENQIFFR